MKAKIHFTVNEYEDEIITTGNTIEELKENTDKERRKRHLDEKRNNMWSEIIEN